MNSTYFLELAFTVSHIFPSAICDAAIRLAKLTNAELFLRIANMDVYGYSYFKSLYMYYYIYILVNRLRLMCV